MWQLQLLTIARGLEVDAPDVTEYYGILLRDGCRVSAGQELTQAQARATKYLNTAMQPCMRSKFPR